MLLASERRPFPRLRGLGGGAAQAAAAVSRFALTAAYMVVEALAGSLTGSLALLSDAGHMLTDVAGLGMALAAIQFAQSRRTPSHTYGLYRLEVLAALANAVLLFGVAGYVLFEAWQRFPIRPTCPASPLLVVATVGLAVNLISFRLLRAGAPRRASTCAAPSSRCSSDVLGSARRDRGRRDPPDDRLALRRPDHRRRDRALHPAPHLAPRPRGAADPARGRPGGHRRRRRPSAGSPPFRASPASTTCTSGR